MASYPPKKERQKAKGTLPDELVNAKTIDEFKALLNIVFNLSKLRSVR